MAVKDGLPATDFSRMNREYIKAVAEGGSGGGGLPEITAADEGKFLGVVSGEAAWATAGGGGGGDNIFTVTFSIDEQTETLTADKTYADVLAATMAGKIIVGLFYGEGFYDCLSCSLTDTYFFFKSYLIRPVVDLDRITINISNLILDSSNNITAEYSEKYVATVM